MRNLELENARLRSEVALHLGMEAARAAEAPALQHQHTAAAGAASGELGLAHIALYQSGAVPGHVLLFACGVGLAGGCSESGDVQRTKTLLLWHGWPGMHLTTRPLICSSCHADLPHLQSCHRTAAVIPLPCQHPAACMLHHTVSERQSALQVKHPGP